jgi:hypothetical protein
VKRSVRIGTRLHVSNASAAVKQERRSLDRPIKRLRQLQSRLEVVVRDARALRTDVLKSTDLGPLRELVSRKRRDLI